MKTDAPELAQLLAREQAIRHETEILRDADIALGEGLSLKNVVEKLLDFLNQLRGLGGLPDGALKSRHG